MAAALLDQLPARLFACLRQMDAQANHTYEGHLTGLRWFNRWVQPASQRKQERTEDSWSDELARRLNVDGVQTLTQQRYPRSKTHSTCDMVVGPPTERIWIEVKGAWQHLRNPDGSTYRNQPYYHHLHDRTAEDFPKLLRLQRGEAVAVAVLLIGFDHESTPMDVDVATMAAQAAVGWSGPSCDQWPDRTVCGPGYRVRCWWWSRQID